MIDCRSHSYPQTLATGYGTHYRTHYAWNPLTNDMWALSRIFITSFPFWMDVVAVCAPFIERLSLEIQSSMRPVTLAWLSLSGMICEHWWDLWCFIFPIPNSRGVKDIAQTEDWKSGIHIYEQRPRLGREFRVEGILLAIWQYRCILMEAKPPTLDMIWCRYLTPGANQSGVRLPIASPIFVKPMMYFPTDECLSAAGGNQCWCAPDDHDQWVLRHTRWLYVVGWYRNCIDSAEWPRLSRTEHLLLQGGSFTQSLSRTSWMLRILSKAVHDISILHSFESGPEFINTLQPDDQIFLDSAFCNRQTSTKMQRA